MRSACLDRCCIEYNRRQISGICGATSNIRNPLTQGSPCSGATPLCGSETRRRDICVQGSSTALASAGSPGTGQVQVRFHIVSARLQFASHLARRRQRQKHDGSDAVCRRGSSSTQTCRRLCCSRQQQPQSSSSSHRCMPDAVKALWLQACLQRCSRGHNCSGDVASFAIAVL